MKKVLITAFACILVAVSCQTFEDTKLETVSEGIYSLTANIAEFEAEPGTKTYIDGSATTIKPLWSTGDEIKLFDTDGKSAVYVVDSADAGKASAKFTLKAGETALSSVFCAYYPASNAISYAYGTGITANIPSVLTYTEATTGDGVNKGTFSPGSYPMVARGTFDAESKQLNLDFKNVFGLVQLKLTGSEQITQIDIMSTSPLSGIAYVRATETPYCDGFPYKYNYVTMKISGVTLGSTAKSFYIPVPVGDINYIGVKIGGVSYKKSLSKSVERSKILNLAAKSPTTDYTPGEYYQEAPSETPVTCDGDTWAPVNCGYSSQENGLYYQWARKYGQISSCGHYINSQSNSMAEGNSISNALFFYKVGTTGSWFKNPSTDDSWSEEYDPCPEGWKVPSWSQLQGLFFTDYKTSGTTKKARGSYDATKKGWDFKNGMFFKGNGYLEVSTGAVSASSTGRYLSSEASPAAATNNRFIIFQGTDPTLSLGNNYRAYGRNVRCVKK